MTIFTLYLTHQPTSLISIILQEVIALVDRQDMMTRAVNLSQKALADFFKAMEPQLAHWYCIKSPIIGEANFHYVKCKACATIFIFIAQYPGGASCVSRSYNSKEIFYPSCYMHKRILLQSSS